MTAACVHMSTTTTAPVATCRRRRFRCEKARNNSSAENLNNKQGVGSRQCLGKRVCSGTSRAVTLLVGTVPDIFEKSAAAALSITCLIEGKVQRKRDSVACRSTSSSRLSVDSVCKKSSLSSTACSSQLLQASPVRISTEQTTS